jgi:hypothetical protein
MVRCCIPGAGPLSRVRTQEVRALSNEKDVVGVAAPVEHSKSVVAETNAKTDEVIDEATRVKVTVNLRPEDLETLRAIAKRRKITMTEALRRAIAMERFVEAAIADGGNLLVEQKDKRLRQLVLVD